MATGASQELVDTPRDRRCSTTRVRAWPELPQAVLPRTQESLAYNCDHPKRAQATTAGHRAAGAGAGKAASQVRRPG